MLIAEIEPVGLAGIETVDIAAPRLQALLSAAVQRYSDATAIGPLADAVVSSFRDMLGYDRVMVYKFDPDGHGKIIAEARDPRLETLLGHHYPASDIPQRARELYLRNRLRVLVDVHYVPSPLQPRLLPGADAELDMSMCYLRSMSPLHLQYLKNMGVTATLVVSLVREGRLWGLIACHHYSARNLRFAVRAAADLLAEVDLDPDLGDRELRACARRDPGAPARAAPGRGDLDRRRLAPRPVPQPAQSAPAARGDGRRALPRRRAADGRRGAVDGRAARIAALDRDAGRSTTLFSCNSVARANPALDALTPTASGVLAVRLSSSRPDYLVWFRKEQLLTVTWAGDPSKPVVGNDPLELSPRRSFAAWSEIVRGTGLPWTSSEESLARAFGASLIDIMVQINAVRLLIAEHQLGQIRATVGSSNEPVVVADASGRTLFANPAFVGAAPQGQERAAGAA